MFITSLDAAASSHIPHFELFWEISLQHHGNELDNHARYRRRIGEEIEMQHHWNRYWKLLEDHYAGQFWMVSLAHIFWLCKQYWIALQFSYTFARLFVYMQNTVSNVFKMVGRHEKFTQNFLFHFPTDYCVQRRKVILYFTHRRFSLNFFAKNVPKTSKIVSWSLIKEGSSM